MTVVLMIFFGLLLGLVGMATVAAATVVSQVDLYRWATGRESGAKAARSLLSSPSRTTGAAFGLSGAGALLLGLIAWGALEGVSPVPAVLAMVLLVIPLAVTTLHSLPVIFGLQWPEMTIKAAVPVVSRLAPFVSPAIPAGPDVRPQPDLTRMRLRGGIGETGADELTVVSGVLEFTERQVREVMTPRTELVAVMETATPEEICEAFIESGFSRLPVYDGSLDNIVGMYYAFDLLKSSGSGELPVRPVTLVPLTRLCGDLLFAMQRDRIQVAVVLDEYGGTAGIATLNDLLADLVDEIFEASPPDERDSHAHPAILELAGSASVGDVAQRFGVSIPEGAETVSGLLSSALGRIPAAGERFEMEGLEFDVVAATPSRVERVAVRRAGGDVIRLNSAGGE